jgi:hypothetical protein
VPADGAKAANSEGAETSVRRRFWAALRTSQCLPLYGQMAVREVKHNRGEKI